MPSYFPSYLTRYRQVISRLSPTVSKMFADPHELFRQVNLHVVAGVRSVLFEHVFGFDLTIFSSKCLVCCPSSPHRGEQNKERLVQMFIAAGSPINQRDNGGLLFTVVRAGASTSVLQLLIDCGAKPDAAPADDPTPLIMLAAGMVRLPSVRVLVRF